MRNQGLNKINRREINLIQSFGREGVKNFILSKKIEKIALYFLFFLFLISGFLMFVFLSYKRKIDMAKSEISRLRAELREYASLETSLWTAKEKIKRVSIVLDRVELNNSANRKITVLIKSLQDQGLRIANISIDKKQGLNVEGLCLSRECLFSIENNIEHLKESNVLKYGEFQNLQRSDNQEKYNVVLHLGL